MTFWDLEFITSPNVCIKKDVVEITAWRM